MIGNLVCLVTPGPAINSFAPHLAVSTRLVFDTIFEKRNKRKKKEFEFYAARRTLQHWWKIIIRMFSEERCCSERLIYWINPTINSFSESLVCSLDVFH